jgi:hypothetical protein
MCYEISYLYIGLLTQLSYLTYVGFLNKIVRKHYWVEEHGLQIDHKITNFLKRPNI